VGGMYVLRQRYTSHCTTDGYQIRRGSIGMSKTSTVLPGLCSNRLPFFSKFYAMFSFANFLQRNKFNSDGAVQIAFKDFIDSRPNSFFSKGINELPMRWQNCINNNGSYFDEINL
jgi:hypothetical protein